MEKRRLRIARKISDPNKPRGNVRIRAYSKAKLAAMKGVKAAVKKGSKTRLEARLKRKQASPRGGSMLPDSTFGKPPKSGSAKLRP